MTAPPHVSPLATFTARPGKSSMTLGSSNAPSSAALGTRTPHRPSVYRPIAMILPSPVKNNEWCAPASPATMRFPHNAGNSFRKVRHLFVPAQVRIGVPQPDLVKV